jgi:Tol biopolymer transport system component
VTSSRFESRLRTSHRVLFLAILTSSSPRPRPSNQPAWSPDGTRIVFVMGLGGPTELWTARLDGSDMIALTHDSDDNRALDWGVHAPCVGAPCLSPSGT